MEFLQEEFESILSRIQHEEKQRNSKRRWLMVFPTLPQSELKHLKKPKFLKKLFLPESMLREDDVSYDTVKTCVERGFEAFGCEREHHVGLDYLQLIDSNTEASNIMRVLFSMIDDMTNSGLYLLANILGSTVKFEKTRWRMKKVIKEHLPTLFGDQSCKDYDMALIKKLSQILKDPHNFRENCSNVVPVSQSHHVAVTKVLEGLEDMPFQTLCAMHRKLRGVQGGIPQLLPPKSGWTRDRLIEQVRKTCDKMLSELDEGDNLTSPLTKAMAVADLSFKLTTGYQNFPVMEFHQFSPEIEALHEEIINAIWFLKKVGSLDLNDLQLLLDPNVKFQNRNFRTAIKKMLTEYLFECSEMETIPKMLRETLSIINKSCRGRPPKFFSKEEIEKEVECVLCVSSQTRQIVWDLLPAHEFDQEFADAYMEDLEESNFDEDEPQAENKIQTSCFYSNDSDGQVESTGESLMIESILPSSTTTENGSPHLSTPNRKLTDNSIEGSEPQKLTELYSGQLHGFGSSSCQESRFLHESQNKSENHFLKIQESCDETSLVAHRLIGRLLEEFSLIEGIDLDWSNRSYLRGGDLISEDPEVAKEMQTSSKDDMTSAILVQVVEELIPSLPKSGIERVKELMGLQ